MITTNLPIWTLVSWLMITYLILDRYRLGKEVDRLSQMHIAHLAKHNADQQEQQADLERRCKELGLTRDALGVNHSEDG